MEFPKKQNIRIGDLLVELGYVNSQQINAAIEYQKEHAGVRMGKALIDLNYITEGQMLEALGHRLNYDVVNISDITVDANALEMIPRAMAEKYTMLGYQMDDGMYYIIVNDPLNFYGIEDIRQVVGMELHISLAEEGSLKDAIQYHYSEVSAKKAAAKAATNTQTSLFETVEINIEDSSDDTPIVNLLNSILLRAYNSNASDIHIEPFEKHTTVRMRVDGVICDFMTLQKNVHNPLIARIKILGDLDIAERRIPQDGHFRIGVEGVNLNVRVSVIPTVFGEKAVMRLLANNSTIDHAGTFGMTEKNFKTVRRMLQSPNGLIYL
ncbi:MAG: Flp pilus assembly complex ATPase component TadA, partial [Lachnospiraceae bacterium]|nr:Flp pilus assembly complex ATPase component TadA [Lachnospiraceae bacterium]